MAASLEEREASSVSGGTASCEYQAVKRHYSSLVKQLQHVLPEVLVEFFSHNLISSQDLGEAMSSKQPSFNRASEILRVILTKIEINTKWYHILVDVLKESSNLREIGEDIEKCRALGACSKPPSRAESLTELGELALKMMGVLRKEEIYKEADIEYLTGVREREMLQIENLQRTSQEPVPSGEKMKGSVRGSIKVLQENLIRQGAAIRDLRKEKTALQAKIREIDASYKEKQKAYEDRIIEMWEKFQKKKDALIEKMEGIEEEKAKKLSTVKLELLRVQRREKRAVQELTLSNSRLTQAWPSLPQDVSHTAKSSVDWEGNVTDTPFIISRVIEHKDKELAETKMKIKQLMARSKSDTST